SRGWRVSQPRRSPAADQRTGGSWGLLRSWAAQPSSFFRGTREAAYWNYPSSPLAMTGISGIELTNSCQDRKSTRLNSSHVSISYAVFSVKKKKELETKQVA